MTDTNMMFTCDAHSVAPTISERSHIEKWYFKYNLIFFSLQYFTNAKI